MIAQLTASFTINSEEKGAIRIYGYRNTEIAKGWGFGISGDLRITRRLYTYARFGQNLDSLANQFSVKNSWSGGMQLRNYQLWESASISTGLAYGNSQGFSTVEGLSMPAERILEAYVRFNIKQAFFISPHYQDIWNGQGLGGEQLNMIGVRTRVAF